MKKLIILMMLISACVSTQAQKHRRVKRAPVKVEAKPSSEEKLYASMLPSTAKIMFIDSLVVDRDSFLTKIPLVWRNHVLQQILQQGQENISNDVGLYQ